jgi:AraC-like DNA-binding protein
LIVTKRASDSTISVVSISRQNNLIDTDFDSLLQPYPGWQAEWIHLGPAPASHHGVRVSLGTGSFTSINTSAAGILRGTVGDDTVALLASAPGSPNPRNCSQTIGGNRCLLLGPGANLDLYLPPASNLTIVAMPDSAVEASRTLAGPDAVQYCELDESKGELISRCIDSLEQIRNDPSSPAAQRQLRDLLKPAAALFRDASPSLTEKRTRLQRHVAVIRACEFVDSHLRAPIALVNLCEAAGVSTRALEYGFRDFYDLGPMAYVRNLRLCRVRHDLLDPTQAPSVSSAARRWSFTHMGQFSHDYRALFGEMPSKTLAAHQRAAKATGPAS